jgi:phosphatidylserine decarboxylase
VTLGVNHKGPKVFPCDANLRKGELMGWFEHGSTIIVFAPKGFSLHPGIECGARIRVGEPLMRLPS